MLGGTQEAILTTLAQQAVRALVVDHNVEASRQFINEMILEIQRRNGEPVKEGKSA